DATTYPDGVGASAVDLLETSSSVVQNLAGGGAGVAVGTIDHHPTSPLNSSGAVSWTITTNNPITMANTGVTPALITISQASDTTTQITGNTLTINGTAGLILQSNLQITNVDARGLITISPPISGAGNVTVAGPGTTLFSGTNTYTGTTTINSGTLNAGGEKALGGSSAVTVNTGGTLLFSGATSDRINDNATIALAGGTLNTGGLSEFTAGTGSQVLPGMGALTLTSPSTIDLGTIASVIAFANSNGTWTGTLKILNWTGSLSGNGTDQIYFGTDTSGLTSTQLSQISFYSDATGTNFLGFGSWAPDNDGEVVPLQPIPEPATWVGGALALGAIAFASRKRFRRA
ncbi:MAG TPA: autotransporter-associated beta strand repeat-containing protein, partial [Chthoniobacterales bacterium]